MKDGSEAAGTNEDQWRARLKAWQASGLSLEAFCEQEGIKVASLRYLKRKVLPSNRRRELVKLPVRLAHLVPPLEVVVSGRFTIRVPIGFPDEELTRVLAVVDRLR